MADFTKKNGRPGALRDVVLLVKTSPSDPVGRTADGLPGTKPVIEVLCTVGANQKLVTQYNPALNDLGGGRSMRPVYSEDEIAAITVAAARGRGGSAQSLIDSAGRVRGQAYVICADLEEVADPAGAHVGPQGRYNVRIDAESVRPAPIDLLIPRGVERAQRECVALNRAAGSASVPSPAAQPSLPGL